MTKNNNMAPSGQFSFSIALGFVAVLLFFLVAGFIAYQNIQTLKHSSTQITSTHDTILTLSELASLVKDAETGQRGYILTGESAYLQPYEDSLAEIRKRLDHIEKLTENNKTQQASIVLLRQDVKKKLDELQNIIDLRRSAGLERAVREIKTDRGKQTMDSIRTTINAMQEIESSVRAERLESMAQVYVTAIIGAIITSLIGIALGAAVTSLLSRASKLRSRQDWLQGGESGISSAVLGDKNSKQLGESILGFLAHYSGAQAGAFFVRNGNRFSRVATYGVPKSGTIVEQFDLGDGLIGQVAKDKKSMLLRDVPEGYLTIGSALGQDKPRHLIIAPATNEDQVNAVFELGFLEQPNQLTMDLLELIRDSIGTAVRSADYRQNLQNLLDETQRAGQNTGGRR